MGTFTKYPSIENLHRVPEILQELEVIVTEKIHGTNVRFGWVEGGFRVGGRNEMFDFSTSAPSTGMGFLGWLRETPLPQRVQELSESLGTEITFYGEWHGRGIQRNIQYAEGKDLRIFDVRIGENLADWDEVVRLTEAVGLKTIPLLYRGAPSLAFFDELRVKPSVVAYENELGSEENLAEGIVIKPAHMRKDAAGNWLMAKHKNPRWEERKSLIEDKPKPEIPADAQAFVDEFFTPQRLEHVLTGLREAGVDITATSATGSVIRSMYMDVEKEAKVELATLSKEARTAVGKIHPARTKALLSAYWAGNL